MLFLPQPSLFHAYKELFQCITDSVLFPYILLLALILFPHSSMAVILEMWKFLRIIYLWYYITFHICSELYIWCSMRWKTAWPHVNSSPLFTYSFNYKFLLWELSLHYGGIYYPHPTARLQQLTTITTRGPLGACNSKSTCGWLVFIDTWQMDRQDAMRGAPC